MPKEPSEHSKDSSSDTIIETVPEAIDYFAPITVNDSYEDRLFDRINPTSGFDGRHGGSLKFYQHASDWFTDLSDSFVWFKLRIVGKDEQNKSVSFNDFKDTKLTVINNIAHSIFSQIRVKVGNTTISYSDADYPYKAYIPILLSGSNESHDVYFRRHAGFIKDTAGHFDTLNVDGDLAKAKNKGGYNRRKELFSANDAIGEFMMKPHSGIFSSGHYLVPYLSFEIELVRNENPNYYLLYDGSQDKSSFKIEILDAAFFVRKYKFKVPPMAGLELALAKGRLVKFNIPETCITTFTIPQGTTFYQNNALFNSLIATRIIIGMVDAEAYTGKNTLNPFNFKHFNRTHIRLLKNGVEWPEQEQVTNFNTGSDPSYIMAHYHFLNSLNCVYTRDVPPINYYEYANGYFLTSFNMAPDGVSAMNPHNAAYKPANIRLEIKFGTQLPQAVQVIVYTEVINQMSIDFKRNVTVVQQ
jgi:hypothetical protein